LNSIERPKPPVKCVLLDQSFRKCKFPLADCKYLDLLRKNVLTKLPEKRFGVFAVVNWVLTLIANTDGNSTSVRREMRISLPSALTISSIACVPNSG
jgi:hypothetical protein